MHYLFEVMASNFYTDVGFFVWLKRNYRKDFRNGKEEGKSLQRNARRIYNRLSKTESSWKFVKGD